MDKSAKKLAGLAIASFCLALVWTTQGLDRPKPKPVIPTKAPAKKLRPILTPPPAMKNEAALTAFAQQYLKFSPELNRVVTGTKIAFRGTTIETTDL